ncbi:MAG: hypothetical protein K0R66_1416 [Gammaproteobacteria bacterium]|jgi:regulatory protein|nr:hypothetical protein [Gammaproteobacteria bacterium]
MAELNDIKNKAIEYLARREHSRYELKQKLLRKFPQSENNIAQAIQELADKKLQSDKRFTESLIQHRAHSGYGLLRIKQELSQQHIDAEIVSSVLEDLEIDWLEVAQRLYQKRFSDKPAKDFTEQLKRSRYLYSHGFTQEEIKALQKQI